MTTAPPAQPVATQPGPPESSSPTRPDPQLRRPRSVAMPALTLVARFDVPAAERITGWQNAYARAMAALGSAEDIQPGGRDHLAAVAATSRAVRDAPLTGRDPDEEAEVEQLAKFLRDEPATRLARPVVEVVKPDVALDGLLADVAADGELLERVDAAVEEWVARMCRLVDSDAPGAVEQAQQANATEWRAFAELLAWVNNPKVSYRLRDSRNTDARLVEALVAHGLRHGRAPLELPYQGGTIDGVPTSGGFSISGRYDPDGRVLVEVSMPASPVALGPPPEPQPPPVEEKARNRWGWLSA